MNQDVITKVIRRLQTVYGAPQSDYPAELLAEFSAALAPYRSDILTKGVDRVIRERAF